jgi:ABC-type multidrug transport system fused ATPase/permease subunit
MLAVVPIIIVAAFGFGRFIRKLSRKTQDSLAQTSVIVEETLQGIQSVKAYTNEQYEIKRYQAAIAEMVGLALKGAKWRGAFASFVIFTLFGAITLILWRGFHLMAEGEITMGELTTFLLFTTFLGAAFASIGENYGQLQRTLGATERIQELLAEPTENLSYHANPAQNPLNIKGDVVFENVHFAYPGRETTPVLKGIDLSVSAGQKLALVGSSGAGKTTLTALLMRFYDPTSGRITIDGQPADAYPLAQLRERMAIVPQDVLLFGGTIRENIAYGKLTATEQQIMDAAKRANALEFINTFPEGLDTIVGERGVRLSGGQRQRIAIARAILRNPAILILDEATSALDSESERLVQAALEELMVGRTTFIIAHRLSTVREADSIAVLHNGLIVEQGTHAELIQHTDGIYKMLATLQFTANQL